MKKLLYIIFLTSVMGLLACEKKSKWEKAGDSIEDAAEKVGDAAEEDSEKASKKVKRLFK